MNRQPDADDAEALLRSLTRALAAAALLTAVFTAVNVTRFATAHGVPWPIAVLLDPMVALALATVLLADARLASWGIRPPRWSTALRWFTAVAATLMNAWTSLWPDGHFGWPRRADPAGVLLHTVPSVLLILLTETVAAYRNRIAELLAVPPPGPSATAHERLLLDSAPGGAPAGSPLLAGAPPVLSAASNDASRPASTSGVGSPTDPHWPTYPNGTDTDHLLASALDLDAEHRSRTGQSMSIRQLKQALHVGHTRAKALRSQIDTHRTSTVPSPAPERSRTSRDTPTRTA
ncbi:hypothetical protein [Streptomyces sp. NPDC003077]|uniref:hypothetical protein n=1 Tax=Streptomyces sp. NPDC003077 TaxID=3154443 RepID=UPI0033B34830